MLEPLSMLSSILLKDSEPDVYMESLNFLNFIVGGIAQHLSSFDLHLLVGSSLNALMTNNAGDNVRT